mmetsp:Transcript_114417/g.334513  ORF Transcript_114417/g.334513 Transcript_114417/m.334513 type:complete len:366 (-) Transcript_114417:699-1796(-)
MDVVGRLPLEAGHLVEHPVHHDVLASKGLHARDALYGLLDVLARQLAVAVLVHHPEGVGRDDAQLGVDLELLPDARPDLQREQPHQQRVHRDAAVGLGQELGVDLEVGADGGRVPLPPEVADGGDLVRLREVDGLACHVRHKAVRVQLHAVVVLHPARVWRVVRLPEAYFQHEAGHGHGDDDLGLLELALEDLQGQVLVLAVVPAPAHVAAFEHGSVTAGLTTQQIVHIEGVANPREQVRAHGDAAAPRVEGGQGPVQVGDERQLRLLQRVEHGVRLVRQLHQLRVRGPVLHREQLGGDAGAPDAAGGPGDVHEPGLVPVEPRLQQPRALHQLVHDVVVVAAEDQREVELAASALILRLVEVAQR